jgi:hypothetical protein
VEPTQGNFLRISTSKTSAPSSHTLAHFRRTIFSNGQLKLNRISQIHTYIIKEAISVRGHHPFLFISVDPYPYPYACPTVCPNVPPSTKSVLLPPLPFFSPCPLSSGKWQEPMTSWSLSASLASYTLISTPCWQGRSHVSNIGGPISYKGGQTTNF